MGLFISTLNAIYDDACFNLHSSEMVCNGRFEAIKGENVTVYIS